jgi:hypothetical protein
MHQRLRLLEIKNTRRAGDRTRTGDVQLGKLSEANGMVSQVAKYQRRTASSVVYALTIWREIEPQRSPTVPGFALLSAALTTRRKCTIMHMPPDALLPTLSARMGRKVGDL